MAGTTCGNIASRMEWGVGLSLAVSLAGLAFESCRVERRHAGAALSCAAQTGSGRAGAKLPVARYEMRCRSRAAITPGHSRAHELAPAPGQSDGRFVGLFFGRLVGGIIGLS